MSDSPPSSPRRSASPRRSPSPRDPSMDGVRSPRPYELSRVSQSNQGREGSTRQILAFNFSLAVVPPTVTYHETQYTEYPDRGAPGDRAPAVQSPSQASPLVVVDTFLSYPLRSAPTTPPSWYPTTLAPADHATSRMPQSNRARSGPLRHAPPTLQHQHAMSNLEELRESLHELEPIDRPSTLPDMQISGSNVNSPRCDTSFGCINSSDLVNCQGCVYCYDCEDCRSCINCTDCYDCENCVHCTGCSGLVDQVGVTGEHA
jgi:hypothetical protein